MTACNTILYIEDNEADALMFKHLFERNSRAAKLNIQTVDSVAACKDVFDPTSHLAVLIDWNLPDGTGADVGEFVRSKAATTPLVFVSGIYSANASAEAEALEHCGFEKKGHNNDYVERILHHINI